MCSTLPCDRNALLVFNPNSKTSFKNDVVLYTVSSIKISCLPCSINFNTFLSRHYVEYTELDLEWFVSRVIITNLITFRVTVLVMTVVIAVGLEIKNYDLVVKRLTWMYLITIVVQCLSEIKYWLCIPASTVSLDRLLLCCCQIVVYDWVSKYSQQAIITSLAKYVNITVQWYIVKAVVQ